MKDSVETEAGRGYAVARSTLRRDLILQENLMVLRRQELSQMTGGKCGLDEDLILDVQGNELNKIIHCEFIHFVEGMR